MEDLAKKQAQYLADLAQKYPIISIEDGMDENDWDGWKSLTEKAGGRGSWLETICLLPMLNDSQGIDQNIGNSILIKVNQIGTLSETIAAVETNHIAVYNSDVPPLRRNGRQHHRRSCGCFKYRSNQNGIRFSK